MRQSRGIVKVLRVVLALALVAGYWPEVFAERGELAAAAPRAKESTQSQVPVSAKQAKALLEAAKSVGLDDRKVIQCRLNIPVDVVGVVGVPRSLLSYGYDGEYPPVFFNGYIGYWNCHAESGKPPVLFDVLAANPSVNQTVPLLYDQFKSLGERLTTLHTKRAELKRKYEGYDESFLADIDSDIVRLSKMGMQLASLTIRFYDAVEPGIIKASQNLDVIGARTAALTGLKDFTADIDKANRMVAAAGSDTSLADVLRQVDQAVRELERAVGQSDRRPSR